MSRRSSTSTPVSYGLRDHGRGLAEDHAAQDLILEGVIGVGSRQNLRVLAAADAFEAAQDLGIETILDPSASPAVVSHPAHFHT